MPEPIPDAAPACAEACPFAAGERGSHVAVEGDADGVERRVFVSRAAFAAAAGARTAAALATVCGAHLTTVRTGASSLPRAVPHLPARGFTMDTAATGSLCSRHGAQFDAACVWTGGQPATRLRPYPTTCDAASDTLIIG